MAKNAYLIVSDLHKSYKNLANRIDYRSEIAVVEDFLLSTAAKYKQSGYELTLLLLGDVFHNSYSDVFNAVLDNNFFVVWEKFIGKIYAVLGNHELTYYSSNPFYTLVDKIESKKLQRIMNCVYQPIGLLPILNVVDELRDGEVVFHFNHYSTCVGNPEDGKVNIGLFHQEIVNRQIVLQMEEILHAQVFARTLDFSQLDVLNGYRYCFFGHMHKVYGMYQADNGCVLDYLGSLGRTNVSEVDDNFLERDVPAVIVEDGIFCRVESNKFLLPERAKCVNEVEAEESHKTYELQKQKQIVKCYVPASDDPISNLKNKFASRIEVIQLIDELIGNEIDARGLRILGKANKL